MANIVKKIIDEDINYIKSTRDDRYNNIAKHFIEPCLSECIYFRRDTGWFKSSALKAWVGALHHLIEKDRNEVRLEYLCSPGTDRKTIEAIKKSKSKEEREEILQKSKDKLILDTVLLAAADDIHKVKTSDKTIAQALAHLIVTEKLEIRFAEVKDLENLTIINDEDEDPEIYHPKLGYFKFPDGSEVTFNGSVNESYGGLKKQGEYIDIFCSLVKEHKGKIETHKKVLEDAWEGREKGIRVIKPSDKTMEELKKFLDLHPIRKKTRVSPTPEPTPEPTPIIEINNKLRDYQEIAIKLWMENKGRGILEHATGSGKTFTALNIIRQKYDQDNPFVVIGVPYIPLGEQWNQEIEKFFKNDIEYSIVPCWSDYDDWDIHAWNKLLKRRKNKLKGEKHLVIFIVVNKSLKKFSERLYEKNEFVLDECLFIGDECHNYTTPNYLNSLPQSQYRLGLSATPTVNPEELRDGEIKMMEYFGNVCHTFTLDEAIPEYLCNYYYYPVECHLTEDEFESWEKLWKKTGWQDDENDSSDKGSIFGAMARILGSAEDKIRAFKSILPKDADSKNHSLIFCGDGKDKNGVKDIEKTAAILRESGWSPSRITNEESARSRKQIINNFVEGRTNGLLAIRVLDEGIDIPEIRSAYILASSSNRRQFIQRRGRVLRKLDGIDKVAKIYDLIVMPPERESNAAKKLIEKELNRVEQMSSKALNKDEADAFIEKNNP